ERLYALSGELTGVELDLIDGLAVDPRPQGLELLLGKVRFVERNLLWLAVVGRRWQVDVERIHQRPDEVDHGLEHLGRRRRERASFLVFLVLACDLTFLIDVAVLHKVEVDGSGELLVDDALTGLGADRLAGEELDARLSGTSRKRLGDLFLQPGDK